MCLILWNLDHATHSRCLISASVLSVPAQNGYSFVIVLVSWEALGSSFGEACDVGCFVTVDFETSLAQCFCYLVEHGEYVFRGGGN